jgi:hypothetical protein
MPRNRQGAFVSARDMLELAATLHHRVKHHWEQSQRTVLRSDAKMLLSYIQRKEKRFAQMIDRFLKYAPEDLLEIYFQFTPDEMERLDAFDTWRPDHGSDAKAILGAALEVDAFIETLYRRAAELASNDAVREMFENLAEAVADKQRAEVQNAAWLTDI